MPAPSQRPVGAAGFTLIEVLTVITLMGIVLAISVSGWARWTQANEQAGTASKIEATLRQAQQQAVTEGSSICVLFSPSADSWTTYRGACGATTSTLEGPVKIDSKRVHLITPSFASSAGVTFTSRGTATPGSLVVTRDGSSRQIQIKVEGLTGRVVVA